MKNQMTFLFLLFPALCFAQSPRKKSFESIWSELFKRSFQLKSVAQEKEAIELSFSRSQRHWLPRAYLAGQWFNTNDPTQVFFNNLGQRSIGQNDFIPKDLNHPGVKNFKTASLGLDLPLYEGGFKSSQSSMFSLLVKSSEMELKAKKSEEYSELSRHYGGVLLSSQNSKLLEELKNNLQKIMTSYQVGSQSNPVGYSGLLGLKGVNNRVEGLLLEFQLKATNSKQWINTKIDVTEDWSPESAETLKEYLLKNLSYAPTSSFSSLMLAQEFKVKTMEDAKNMEKSRFLPKIGLFAQNNLYDGSRNSASSQVYGLYLMWDLFNPDSYGRLGEANAKSMAGKAKLEAHKQDEKIMLDQLVESKKILATNLELLENTDRLLKEQTQNAMKLFRSGMLSGLQLAEVINRRVDLIENKNKAENQYLDVYSRIYQLNN